MRLFIQIFSLSFLIVTVSCTKPSNEYVRSGGPTYLNVPVTDIKKDLKSLLNTWYPLLIDTVNGGYWTNLEHDWKISDKQDKMLVTQARGLWTASKAAGIFPDNPVLKKAADHGFKFLAEKMWDKQNQGFRQLYFLGPPPENIPEFKTAYANAFTLFALAEYSKINNDPIVLEWVQKSFNWLENYAHDPDLMGYFDVVLPEGSDLQGRRFPWGYPGLKDQNSSIHIMEALTNVYQVWPDELVQKRLAEILELVRDKMVNSKGSLDLYFTKDWQPIDNSEKSRSYILENIYTNHVSFGHDIETAFLLIDASKSLYGKVDTTTLSVAKKLIDHTLDYGFDKDYYGMLDKGYYFKDSDKIEIVGKHKVWWAQGEALHSLALINQYFPQDKRYVTAFGKMWEYIKEQLVDPQYGGWYNNGLDSDPGNKDAFKGHQWKGCYHNGRTLMMVYQYALEN